MVSCPKCNATLPDGAFQCQFCGTAFAARPPGTRAATGYVQPASRQSSAMPGAPRWVLPTYYFISAWWMLDGILTIVNVLNSKDGVGFFGYIVLIIGGVTALVGLGLILRVDLVRGIVNVLCFLQILDGLLGLGIAFFMTGIAGIWGALMMVLALIRIGFACLMIYLIGETDTRAPNF